MLNVTTQNVHLFSILLSKFNFYKKEIQKISEIFSLNKTQQNLNETLRVDKFLYLT